MRLPVEIALNHPKLCLGACTDAQNVLDGRPQRLARPFWGLVHRIVVFCLLWRRNVMPLYTIVQYSLLLCFGLGICTPSWARARIFTPYYILRDLVPSC